MIRAEVVRRPDGRPVRFVVQGHAGEADGWKAVVCSAASTLSQTAVLGLEELVGLRPEVEIRDGYLSCILPDRLEPAEAGRASDIVGTMLLGFRALSDMHPDLVQVRETVLVREA